MADSNSAGRKDIASDLLLRDREVAERYFDALGMLFLAIDADQKVSFINREGASILGRSREEITGRNWFDDFIPEANRDEVKEVFKKLLSGETQFVRRVENPVLCRNGEEKIISWHNVPLMNADGETEAMVAAGDDITEQMRTKNDYKKLAETYADSLIDLKKREHSLQLSRDAFLNMLEDISESYKDLEELFLKLVRVLVNALDAKSPWTRGHSDRVAEYAENLARAMGLDDDEVKNISLAGMLHDIGKIGTSDPVLDKPGKLTREEFDLVKKHPAQGAAILEGIKQLRDVVPIIKYHHERPDGKGYPAGLKGDEIPLGARILHVADSFDSMTADRPYRKAPGLDYALSEFSKFSGTQFDPSVIGAALEVLPLGKAGALSG
jgi:PAS domain S-box-containing protein/putative nucleotidyltransferase with HDIG domain